MPADIEDLNDFQVSQWPSTEEGEQRQMQQMEEMYRILFAHPQVEAITGWDFADGAWLGAPSGVIRRDNSEKPAYRMLKKLIRKEWWTDCQLTTDENGYALLDGVRGDYLISCEGKSASFKLGRDCAEAKITLR